VRPSGAPVLLKRVKPIGAIDAVRAKTVGGQPS
jgi:hypothetical protein